jgi:hypothetical protein
VRSILLLTAALTLAPPALGDLRVLASLDVVVLYDGTSVKGTVIAVGMKAVIIIVDDVERVIPREQVVTIVRGEVNPEVKGYITEVVEGMKRVTGPGQSVDAEAPAEETAVASQGAPAGRGPGNMVITKAMLLEMMKKNQMLKQIVAAQGGPDAALVWLEKNRSNPEVKRYLESFMQTGKLPADVPQNVRK